MVNSRTKGKTGEREVVNMLKDAGFDAARNLDQVRDGGHDIVGISNVAIEVKRSKVLLLSKWWTQTVKQAGDDKFPVLAYRLDRQKWKVVVTSDFLSKDLPRSITLTLEWDDFIYYLREVIDG